MMSKRDKEYTSLDTVTFKLKPPFIRKLKNRADRLKKRSKNTYAREIVIDYLEDAERARLRREIKQLRNEVKKLRDDFATAVAMLLYKAGKITDPKEAKAWVLKNLLS
jgi:predicted DNA-binding protein